MKTKLLFLTFVLMMSGCESQNTKNNEIKSKPLVSKYVDFKRFSEGRPCNDVIFMCLPESQDKSWQSVPTKDKIEDLELTPEVEAKFDKIVKQWHKDYDAYHSKPHPKGEKEPMLITSLDKDFFDKVGERRFLEKAEKRLEKEFPGFWREVPKKVRYRWIRRTISKANKLGYKGNKPSAMLHLCARIGLDFDLDPKWQYIVKFIQSDSNNIGSNTGTSCDYIDWTIFNKKHSYGGYKITDWAMRDANGHLPSPKKPYPKLNN